MAWVRWLWFVIRASLLSRTKLVTENLALHQQFAVLKRKKPKTKAQKIGSNLLGGSLQTLGWLAISTVDRSAVNRRDRVMRAENSRFKTPLPACRKIGGDDVTRWTTMSNKF